MPTLNSFRIVLTLICVLWAFSFANAQAYRLNADDVINVTVQQHPEFSGDFLIPPDGRIALPGAGVVTVSGLTIDELTNTVRTHLAERLRAPEVTITLRTARMQRLYVLGAVAQPGVYDVKANWRLIEALAAAGGVKEVPADCRVSLLRATGEQQTLALTDVLAARDGANVTVQPGDVVTITPIERLPVYVMGAVTIPGLLELRDGVGVAEALAQAGGLAVPESEATVTLVRDGKTIASAAAREPLTTVLKRGDVVRVDSLRTVPVMVTGRVAKPGFYTLKAGEGLTEAITLAGGPQENAALTRVNVIRSGGATELVDMATAWVQGKNILVALQPGDAVMVPEARCGITVLGAVNQPGYFPISDGRTLRLSEVIALAKGPVAKQSRLSKVALLRPSAIGEAQRQVIDVQRFMATGDPQADPVLADGDIVYVPESKKTDWGLIFQMISTAALVKNATD